MFNLSLLIIVFSVLVALFSFLAEHEKRRRLYRVLTLLCVFVNLLLAFALKHEENSQQLQREQERTKHAQELVIKTEELAKKSDEIARLNKEIASAVTEGESYAFFAFLLGDGSLKNPVAVLMHSGKHPLFDVVLYIYDYAKWKSYFR